jgi:phosphatidylglycerol lysyltransferase
MLALPDEGRLRVHALVLRYGWNAMAFQVLGRGYRYHFHGDGCVAYVDTGAAWVAAGSPICEAIHLRDLADSFIRAARQAGRRCCFFGSESRFVDATRNDLAALPVGEQPVWNPRIWTATIERHRRLRAELRSAKCKGVRIRRVPQSEIASTPALRMATEALVGRWLAARRMPPMGFLLHVDPDGFPEQRQCFLAEQDGRLVGLLYVVPVPERKGWFIEHMVRAPEAPNGTVEALVDAVMGWAAREGCAWLTLGLAPLAGEVPLLLRVARRRLAFLYNFDGLRRFKAKLKPAEWHPIYVSFPRTQGAFFSIIDVLAAFARATRPARPRMFLPEMSDPVAPGALRGAG